MYCSVKSCTLEASQGEATNDERAKVEVNFIDYTHTEYGRYKRTPENTSP